MADSQRGTEQGTVHNCVTLRKTILTQLTAPAMTGSSQRGQRTGAGETFNVIAIGDVEGHSPSAFGVDSNGTLSWQPIGNLRAIDSHVPPTSQELQRQRQSLSSSEYQRA